MGNKGLVEMKSERGRGGEEIAAVPQGENNGSGESREYLRLFYGRGVAQTTQGTSEGDDPSDLGVRWGKSSENSDEILRYWY